MQDDILDKVKANGGVVCINFFPIFLKADGQEVKDVTLEDAVAHCKYIIDRIGWDHVGFGSDFDGIDCGPHGLENVSKYPDLVKELWKVTDATEEQIAKVMGLNVIRVWEQCEQVASSLSKMEPIETNWQDRQWVFHEYIKSFPEIFPGSRDIKKNEYVAYNLVINADDKK